MGPAFGGISNLCLCPLASVLSLLTQYMFDGMYTMYEICACQSRFPESENLTAGATEKALYAFSTDAF